MFISDKEWINQLPKFLVKIQPNGKRYSSIIRNQTKDCIGSKEEHPSDYSIKSTQIVQLIWKRLCTVLDNMDVNLSVSSSISKYSAMSPDEATAIIDSISQRPLYGGISNSVALRNRFPGRTFKLISRMFPVMNDHILILGMEKTIPFYKGLRHPDFAIEESLEYTLVRKDSHLVLARIGDYFIYECINDINFVGVLDFSDQYDIIKDRPPLGKRLDKILREMT